jgi:hypothetical protein
MNMERDIARDPDAWYWDGPEDGSSLKKGPLASSYIEKMFEDITLKAFGQEGLDKYREERYK